MDEKLKKIFSEILEVSISQITENASPETIESWDSLKQMGLIVAIEEEFGIQFEDEAVFSLNDYAMIHSALEKMLSN
jgi:acyl carrier protein